MRKYYKENVAKEEAILCANLYGGTWAVIKYPYDFGVEKLNSYIRIDPKLQVIFKTIAVKD